MWKSLTLLRFGEAPCAHCCGAKQLHLSLLKSFSWKRWISRFTLHVTKKDLWRVRVSETLSQERPFRLVFQQWQCSHHHHHVMPPARFSLTLFCHPSLSSIASSKSSGLHLVSAQSCCMYVLAGCPAFARPCEGVHRSMSLMSSSLLLQQCLACLVRLIWIVFMIDGKWPYSCCFVGCCL